jgi:hypothetical protein
MLLPREGCRLWLSLEKPFLNCCIIITGFNRFVY